MDYSITGLLANVRRIGAIPTSVSAGNTDTDLLRHLNDELQLTIPSKIIACREGFFKTTKDHTLVNGTLRYRLPTRALGNRLASATLVDGLGNTLWKLDEVPDSRLAELYSITQCVGYRLEAGDMVFVPSFPVSQAATLRMRYYIRPNELSTSLDTAAGQCFTVVSVAGQVVTLMASHGLTTGTRVDILKGTAPFEHMSIDLLPTAVASTTVTFAASVDLTRIEAGDIIAKAGYSPFAQIPDAFYPLLSHLAALKYALAKGDGDAVASFEKLLPKLEAEAVAMVSPRNEEGAKKIMSQSGAVGALGNRFSRRTWGY